MKHDYAAVKQELLMALTEDSASRWATFCRENYPTIKHALAMMQKLEEPSEGMVHAVFKAILEQAEKEIEG